MTSGLRDLSRVIREYGAWRFFRRLYGEINDDNVFTNAAAIAYAWMFAVFPFVIFVISLFPYLPSETRAQAMKLLGDILKSYATPEGASTILDNVSSVLNTPRGGLLSFGLLLTIFAASGGMNTTMSSLDQAFDVAKPRSYVIKRLVAMLLTIFMCVCVIILIVMFPLGAAATSAVERYNEYLPAWVTDLFSGASGVFLTVARYAVGLAVLQILIGVVFHFGRSERQRLRFFTPGSIFTGVGWILTGMAMGFYVENFADYSKTYGAVAGMVIMLMVFYLNAIMVLVGAEIDSEIKHACSELDSHFREDQISSRPVA